jgi:uncharacterized protein
MDVDRRLADVERLRLVDLTTFRSSGEPVRTPVRFAVDGDRIVFSLQSDSGKVKRLRADPRARVSDRHGVVVLDGTMRLLVGAEAQAANAALKKRYKLLTLQRFVFGRHPARHVSAEFRPSVRP